MTEAVSWLIGTWRCEQAFGSYPTIKDFTYGEEIQFGTFGKPMLTYNSKSWHPEKKTPMHMESGFMRFKPESKYVSFFVAHNFGVTSVEEGQVQDHTLELTSTSISRMSFAKDPSVIKTIRSFELNEKGELVQTLYMETQNTPMTKHLESVYKKVE